MIKVLFPVTVFQKLRAYVNALPYEISGLGKVNVTGKEIIVEDVKIFTQRVTEGDTVIDKEAVAQFYDELMEQNDDLKGWKMWWHSHADINAFFSGTDENTIEDFDNESANNNWLISLVTNRRGETKLRLDVFYPTQITVEDVQFDVSVDNEELKQLVAQEVKEKVFLPEKFKKNKNTFNFWKKDDKTKLELPSKTYSTTTGDDEIIVPPFSQDEITKAIKRAKQNIDKN